MKGKAGALMPSFCSPWCYSFYGPKNQNISVFQVSFRFLYGLKGRAISKGSMIEGGLRAVSSWMFMEVGGVHSFPKVGSHNPTYRVLMAPTNRASAGLGNIY